MLVAIPMATYFERQTTLSASSELVLAESLAPVCDSPLLLVVTREGGVVW